MAMLADALRQAGQKAKKHEAKEKRKRRIVACALLMLMAVLTFTACSGSSDDEESTETETLNKVVGSWYCTNDNHIYVLDVAKGGTGSVTTYTYENSQWSEETTTLKYTVSNAAVTVMLQGKDAWSGALAITGNNMSITKDTEVFMFTKFDGSASAINELKSDAESSGLDTKPDGVINETSYGMSEEGVMAALNSLYLSLRKYEYNQLNLENIRIYGVNLSNNPQNITPTSDEVAATWNAAYSAISLANNIVTAIQDKAEYKKYRNEALAIRSLIYYNVANLWGTIPYTEGSGEDAIYNIPYSCEQVIGAVKSTLLSLDVLTDEDYHINAETVKALLGEISLWENDKTTALNYLGNCTSNFSVIINSYEESKMYSLLGEEIPNYTTAIVELLKKEAKADTADIAGQWQKLGTHVWGYWSMLKRTGNAMAICGCKDYELLMPIPSSELAVNPMLTQNTGY